MVKWIAPVILLLPLAEIATFVAVVMLIGFGWAIAASLATSAVGLLVLRLAGRGRLRRFRGTVAGQDAAAFEAGAAGFLTVLAGILLFLPGFLTDLAGLLLLLPPVQRTCATRFRTLVMGAGGGPAVVDLDPGEWRQERDEPRDPGRITRQ